MMLKDRQAITDVSQQLIVDCKESIVIGKGEGGKNVFLSWGCSEIKVHGAI